MGRAGRWVSGTGGRAKSAGERLGLFLNTKVPDSGGRRPTRNRERDVSKTVAAGGVFQRLKAAPPEAVFRKPTRACATAVASQIRTSSRLQRAAGEAHVKTYPCCLVAQTINQSRVMSREWRVTMNQLVTRDASLITFSLQARRGGLGCAGRSGQHRRLVIQTQAPHARAEGKLFVLR